MLDIHRMVHRPEICENPDDRQRQIQIPDASSAGVLPSMGLPHRHFPDFPELNRHHLTSAKLHPSRLSALFSNLSAISEIRPYEQCIGTCYRAKQYPFSISGKNGINTVNQTGKKGDCKYQTYIAIGDIAYHKNCFCYLNAELGLF